MNNRTRTGVMGGTFDPPHVGHRIVAQDVCEALQLDRLLIVPAPRPPHREAVLDAETRFRLATESFRGDPRIEVSRIEFGSAGASYTVDTLVRLRAATPDEALWLVIGSDQYEALDTWKCPGRILEMAELAVMTRGGNRPTPDSRYPYREIAVTRVDVSSTMIRDRLDRGESIRYLVPDNIEKDIEAAWAMSSAADRPMGQETTC